MMMNMVKNKAQMETALMTQTILSAAVPKLLHKRLGLLLKIIMMNRNKIRVEIRRSLRLTRVRCTIRKWPWMIEFS